MAEDGRTFDAAATEAVLSGKAADRDLLRFLTCGSVDDGKSTLIGRVLYDSKLIFEDQLKSLERDSKVRGRAGGALDLSLLVDGLQQEREQGITIDVAWRYFNTDRRKFIVADTPGHEQYTRNMATGASNADLAVLLVDARKGVLVQTRRHATIAKLMGLRHVVLAVNKMDLVGYDQTVYDAIRDDFLAFAAQIGLPAPVCIPVSALMGDNVVNRGEGMPWYDGPALLPYLEEVDVVQNSVDAPFRFPVQWVNRPNLDFRGYCGTIASGRVRPGDQVVVHPSARQTTVARVVDFSGDRDEAVAGESVTLTLTDEVDIARGDLLSPADARPDVADQMAAHVIWMADERMLPERSYLLKIGHTTVPAQITEIKHRLDVNTQNKLAAKHLDLNEVAFCNLSLARPVPFDPYETNRATGGFILIDRTTHQTVGCGMIAFGLRRAENIHWQALSVDKATRATQKHQTPGVLWFTGLSGAGKSTVANLVEKRLMALGHHSYILDGDNVRHGLNRDLGFTPEDRVENIRRVAEVSRLFVDAGLIVLVSFISPYRAERRLAREKVADGEFLEVFVDTPLAVCEARDPKGLYKKARAGQIKNFTGIDSEYEPPEAPELHLNAGESTPDELAEQVIQALRARGMLRE
ncbi:sulfate adenylyltransferase subunit CysN [Roseospira marina]|uniref:Multifunctional fusion protein n=1 Tax=Roseospira marina TaxID=140057 RepID=A0A5M6IB79_9PROT|nr:sulfate adenylyltransferase subunit CysN [Roseospira marina]KAA5605506.1 sulfate adenylyltransferase subunit CysN [Roseospira marina]MBB4314488.1 bifunctional enzyme CysN/CysC [Roseospira marina]MBB5088684.1 bifunctional enzyme CysN/CysC [Roseospira marina]